MRKQQMMKSAFAVKPLFGNKYWTYLGIAFKNGLFVFDITLAVLPITVCYFSS